MGQTALHGAASRGQVEVVNRLLDCKEVDVNIINGVSGKLLDVFCFFFFFQFPILRFFLHFFFLCVFSRIYCAFVFQKTFFFLVGLVLKNVEQRDRIVPGFEEGVCRGG